MNKKITIQELASSLAQNKGITKKAAEAFIRTFFDTIVDNLQKDKLVKIKGMGTFKLSDMEDRESVDVNTGERIVIKGYTKATFTPDTTLRDEINKPFAQFETVILNESTVLNDTETIDENEQTQEEEQNPIEAQTSVEEIAEEITTEVADSLSKRKKATETANKEITEKVEEVKHQIEQEIVAEEINSDKTLPEEETDTEKEVSDKEKAAAPEAKELSKVINEKVVIQKENAPVADTVKENNKLTLAEETHKEEIKKKAQKGGFFIWILLLLLLVAGACYFFWQSGSMKFEKQITDETLQEQTVSMQPVTTHTDSLIQDTVIVVEEPQHVYPQMQEGDYEIVGVLRTHEIKSGETLRTIAGDVYGSRDMSIYLIFFNKIENPDIVPVGMSIEIPELKLKQR